MSSELKTKKRKGASEPATATKKAKVAKSADKPAPEKSALKKAKRIRKDVEGTTKPATKAKRAAEAVVEDGAVKAKKAKIEKSKPPEGAETSIATTNAVEKGMKNGKTVPKKTVVEHSTPGAEQEDDNTAVLLAGFESSEDEADPQDDGIAIDTVPNVPTSKAIQKQLKAAENDAENSPGVIYIGRIPHGFYEHQMKAYFSQFGTINHLRLSRNKLTGKSKHYAFIEFASAAVADIVVKTMDKYLMFNHILQVRRVQPEQVHENMFKGADKRFKAMPRNRLEGSRLKRGATREEWDKRIKKEEKRRQSKSEKLKELGYEFDMPTVKGVSEVPVKSALTVPEESATEDGGVKLPESAADEASVADAPVAEEVITTVQSEPGSVTVTKTVVKKARKSGKEAKKAKPVKSPA